MRPRFWIPVFYLVLLGGLAYYLFGLARYNGGDYQVYLNALDRMRQGLSPYDYAVGMSFHYLPCTLPFFSLLSALGSWQHWGVMGLSALALLRMTWILMQLGKPATFSSDFYFLLFFFTPWIWVSQGIGAQFESGNVNLILLYLGTEGFYQLVQAEKTRQKTVVFFLMMLPMVFKPQFAFLPYFVWVWRPKAFWKPFFLSAIGIGLLLLSPVGLYGPDTAMNYYQDWLGSNRTHAEEILRLQVVAENYSLFSLAYHKWNWPLHVLYGVFGALFLAFHFCIWKQEFPLRVLSYCGLFTFLFFPASFPYSLLSLLPSIQLALRTVSLAETAQWKRWVFWGFAMGSLFLTVDVMGRSAYQAWVIPWRLKAWVEALLFLF